MPHTLITFLGRAEREYEPVDYRFENELVPECRYLGLELPKVLAKVDSDSKIDSVDRVIFLGTNSSCWDLLYLQDNSDEYITARYALLNRVLQNQKIFFEDTWFSNGEVDHPSLPATDKWAQLVDFLKKQSIHKGYRQEACVISYGLNRMQQLAILESIAKLNIEEGCHVTLDITHGLRHLPLLAVLIAMYLQKTRKVQIAHILYGAYDLRQRTVEYEAPVLDMKGMLCIAEWIGALETFDKDRDYSVFADLLKEDGFPDDESEYLKQAAFAERTFYLLDEQQEGAVKMLQSVHHMLSSSELLPPSSLFRNELQTSIEWSLLGSDEENKVRALYLKQRKLASLYLDKKNYVQTAIFAIEAFVTKLFIDEPYGYDDHGKRAKKQGPYCDPENKGNYNSNFAMLKKIRNHMAHANVSNPKEKGNEVSNKCDREAKELFKSERKLASRLSDLIRELLPE